MTQPVYIDNNFKTTDEFSKTHKELFSTNCEYDPDLNKKLCLLNEGGFEIQKCADLFLTRIENLETPVAYQTRKNSVSYIPYMSQFNTQFSSSLFSEQLEMKQPSDADDASTLGMGSDDDFYKQFIEDCDLNGTSWHQFMQDVFNRSLHELVVYVGKDFPKSDEMPNNLMEEEALGLSRGYAYTIPYENVIDWKLDPKTGKFLWLKMFSECFPDDGPLDAPMHYYQFKMWTLQGQGQEKKGAWTTWECDLLPIAKKYTQTTRYKKKDEGTTSFPDIPIDRFCIPKDLHVGLQIGPICQEHYQRRSFLVSNANKTCVSLGVVKLGPEIGAPGDALPADIEPPQEPKALRRELESEGWTVIRDCDDINIIEAKGEAHKFVSEELKSLVEQMMQTLHQMNSSARAHNEGIRRSAQSKQIDWHGTSMLLSVYERKVKDFSKNYFTNLAAGRNEAIHWDPEGLSIATPVIDRVGLIEELTKLGVDIFKFPDLFKSKYIFRSAMELLDNDASDKEKLELQEDIEEAVAAGEFEALESDEAKAAGNKMAAVNLTAPSDGQEEMALGPGGQPQLPDGGHLQTGEHIESKVVFDQLSKDYKEKDIEWVKHIPWIGPVEVPLGSIDFSNQDNWTASKEPGEVDKFADKISNEGFSKPVILVNNPSNDNKMIIVDGHHRSLAYNKLDQPVMAYVGQVGSDQGPWTSLHRQQVGKQEGSGQMQSQQVSVQKKSDNDRLMGR